MATERISTFLHGGTWYKGNTHAHTTLSDGHFSREEVARVYREAGYSFIVFTDHWVYGNDQDLATDSFLIFAGMEMSVMRQSLCHHVTVMADPDSTPFRSGETCEDVQALGDMRLMVERMNEAGQLCIYAHPAASQITVEEYDRVVSGCVGVEVYNHISEVEFLHGHSDMYYERMVWSESPRFCFASDDVHWEGHYLGGFINVKAASLSHKDILDAIRAGSFYASTGPEILDFYVEDRTAYLECSEPCAICFYTELPITYYIGKNANDGMRASFQLPDGAATVFAVCSKDGHKAWTQPIRL